MNEIKAKTHQLIIDRLGLQAKEINDETEFYDDLGVDSLDFFELMVSVEKAFNITIEEDYYGKLKTVGSLVTFVEQNVTVKAPVSEMA